MDTHCHLEEVLQAFRRHAVAPTLNKDLKDFTDAERSHWRTLGWLQEPGSTSGGWENPIWDRFWSKLSAAESEAASFLGYDSSSWDRNEWVLPRKTSWNELTEDMRRALEVLGESAASWDHWQAGDGTAGPVVNSNDMRDWTDLTAAERVAAAALGFTEATWNSEEVADVRESLAALCGPGFEGCVTQGCDADSIEGAVRLTLAHPKVFVSFGCHPKAAWSYDAAFEAQLLEAMRVCGPKVLAWGEFGLDYSHPGFGPDAGNRRQQKEVFVRQLQLAIARGLPLVIHSRCADADTLRIMQRWVPCDWRVHVHSFRGSVQLMQALLAKWQNAYIGIPGIVTLNDPHANELCMQCPLDRLVVETDAPYLPLQGTYFSHPGLVPEILLKVAEIKGIPPHEVFAAARENARSVYRI